MMRARPAVLSVAFSLFLGSLSLGPSRREIIVDIGDARCERMAGESALQRRKTRICKKIGKRIHADIGVYECIELEFTKGHREKHRIVSDADLEITESEDWSRHRGSPRKTIYGKGSFNGGGNKVKIRTINGDVHLKYAG